MKFLKADGTVEEGEPITEAQVSLRNETERYFHLLLCRNRFHAGYEGEPQCQKAANFLSLSVLGNYTESDHKDIAAKLKAAADELLPRPKSNVEPPVYQDVEAIPVAPVEAVAKDFDPF